MHPWVRRVRAMLGMGLTWAVAGALVGGVIELLDNILPGGLALAKRVDVWPQTLAIPGFLGGVIFAAVLMVVGGRYRLEELSVPRFAAWGVLAGLLLGGWGVTNGLPAYVMAITAFGGGATAAGLLALVKRAEWRAAIAAGGDEAKGELPRPE